MSFLIPNLQGITRDNFEVNFSHPFVKGKVPDAFCLNAVIIFKGATPEKQILLIGGVEALNLEVP